MARKERMVPFEPKQNKGGFSSEGKISAAAVKVKKYSVGVKNEKGELQEDYMIVEPQNDIISNSGKVVAKKGEEIAVFMPPEMKVVDGKKVEVPVKSRRDVAGLKAKTGMGYSTGDAMPEGSIVEISKIWPSTGIVDGQSVTALRANYGRGLIHKDETEMLIYDADENGKLKKDEDGNFIKMNVSTAVVYDNNCSISVKPAKKIVQEDGKVRWNQQAHIFNRAKAIEISGIDGLIKAIDDQLNNSDAMGNAGGLITAYRKPPEGADLVEFGEDFDNRMSIPIFAYKVKPEEEGEEWGEPNAQQAVQSMIEKASIPLSPEQEASGYINWNKEMLDAINSNEWKIVFTPGESISLMPSLISDFKDEKYPDKYKFNFNRASYVIDAKTELNEDGSEKLNSAGYPIYSNPRMREYGLNDMNYGVSKIITVLLRKAGDDDSVITGKEACVSWRERKAMIDNDGAENKLTEYSKMVDIQLKGGNTRYHDLAYFAADIITPETPEYFVNAIEKERETLKGKNIAYNNEQYKKNKEVANEENGEQDNDNDNEVEENDVSTEPEKVEKKSSSPSPGM